MCYNHGFVNRREKGVNGEGKAGTERGGEGMISILCICDTHTAKAGEGGVMQVAVCAHLPSAHRARVVRTDAKSRPTNE